MGLLYGDAASDTWISAEFVHPTFLYESLWNLIGLIIILTVYKKKKFNGQICAMYFTWYGFGRMLIEGLRTDSLMIGPIRVSQLVGLVSFIAGIVLLIVLPRIKSLRVERQPAETESSEV